MSATHEKYLTFLNGEAAALPPYRRVKIDGSNPTKVIYADATDGDNWIGTTEPMEGGDAAVGAPVTIRLRCENVTLKIQTTEAVDVGDSLYPEDDGKCSDTAGTVVIGTCINATGGANGITEMLPNAGSGSAPDAGSIANADGTTGAGVPILLRLSGITASAATTIITHPTRKLQVIDVYVTQLGTTATTVTLKNGATSFTDAIAVGATAGVRTRVTTFTTASALLTASAVLNVALATADATGVEVCVLCLPLA